LLEVLNVTLAYRPSCIRFVLHRRKITSVLTTKLAHLLRLLFRRKMKLIV